MFRKTPKIKLAGCKGTPKIILGECQRASLSCWTQKQWEAFRQKATYGDYEHLVKTVMEYFDVS